MSGRSVLIIVRDFIPYSFTLGGTIRVLKMAEFLTQRGVEVNILAARGEQISYFGYEELVKKFRVDYVDDRLQSFLTRVYKEKSRHSPILKRYDSFLYFWKKIVDEFSIPDRGVYFVNKFVVKAKDIIGAHGIKNVIVSSPPHSTQVIGLRLKNMFGSRINLIVDYRDSWNTTGIFAKVNPVSRWLSEQLEKRLLRNADYFIYHSPPVLRKINEKYFDITHKSLLVTNGYDEDMKKNIFPRPPAKNDILTIGHFGSIRDSVNSFRNPSRFFAAVRKFGRKIKIVFYGPANISQEWQESLKGVLEIHPPVSHQEALNLMQEMDILLVLHSQQEGADEVIPAKIYEYILTQRPILVIGPVDMEAAAMVTKKGLGYSMNIYDEKDMLQKLEEIYVAWEKNKLITYNRDNYPEYSRQYQYAKILGILR